MINYHRIKQVLKYGWMHAGQIRKETACKKGRLSLFFDILSCYLKYKMWSNQYFKEKFWELDKQQRSSLGNHYRHENQKREEWVNDFYENRKFLAKWSRYDVEKNSKKRELRNAAYTKHYSMGNDCFVEYGVEFSRQHHLPGILHIGNHVLFAKKVFIDYSGEVTIEDNVKIGAGVTIESHHRDLEAFKQGKDVNIPTSLHICENAYIGTHAIILDSCNYIGKHSRIGAGAVVTKDIPDYSVAVGVPAKVVKVLPHE